MAAFVPCVGPCVTKDDIFLYVYGMLHPSLDQLVRPDRASGIVNDPNDWCTEVGDPRYILDLAKRVVTVSLDRRCLATARHHRLKTGASL